MEPKESSINSIKHITTYTVSKKTKKTKLMMETNIFVNKSKKFDLVYYGKILKPYICYILKKN